MAVNPNSNSTATRRAGGCDSGIAKPQPTPLEQVANEGTKNSK